MANAEQLEIIRQGVEVWNEWRNKHPDVNVKLSGADLRGANLTKANLTKADLRGANLTKANLTKANLTKADLRITFLNEANLKEAKLTKANLWGVKLIEADLSMAKLTEANLRVAFLKGANLWRANLTKANLTIADLPLANLEEAKLNGACLDGACLREARLNGADLSGANLSGAWLHGANLSEAILKKANLWEATLWNADLSGADLSESNLRGTHLGKTVLVGTNLDAATLVGCNIFGISVWALKGIPKEQSGLIITPYGEAIITVENLQVAQFTYLFLDNKNVRNVIDTITSKAVLILGRFTNKRKAILDALHAELRTRNYLPILFDFDGPTTRDITETVSTLAHMARFVIADITDAKSIPQELQAVVPNLPSVPVKPILLASQTEYGMFEHFKRYPWVLPTYTYDSSTELIASISSEIITPLEAKVGELRQ